MEKEITLLYSTNVLDKKTIHKRFSAILECICFEILSDLSYYIYTATKKNEEYTSFCGNVFLKINDSVTRGFKAKSANEFKECWMSSIIYAREIAEIGNSKIKNPDYPQEDPLLLGVLNEENDFIFNKFFKRTRKKRARKVHNG